MTADESPEALRRKIAELQALLAAQAQPAAPEVAQPTTVSGGYVGQIIGK